jgi:hypothetical protein
MFIKPSVFTGLRQPLSKFFTQFFSLNHEYDSKPLAKTFSSIIICTESTKRKGFQRLITNLLSHRRHLALFTMDVLSYVAAKRINEYQRVRVISIKDIARQHANGMHSVREETLTLRS